MIEPKCIARVIYGSNYAVQTIERVGKNAEQRGYVEFTCTEFSPR